jgi:hypothetical protein
VVQSENVQLTALYLEVAGLLVMGIVLEIHGAGQHQGQPVHKRVKNGQQHRNQRSNKRPIRGKSY